MRQWIWDTKAPMLSADRDSVARLSPLLAALPKEARQHVRTIILKKADCLFRRGDRAAALYFVSAGEMRLVRQSSAGDEIVLQRARRGCFAEASLEHQSYHCDGVAAEPTTVLALPLRIFNEALAGERFRAAWIEHLSRELCRSRAHAERLSLKTARERILHYMETEGEAGLIVLQHSKKDWAAELGITHEALYRTLADMQRSGELTVDGMSLTLQGLGRTT